MASGYFQAEARSLVTHSYSGSDIAVVVRDALMQPVRKVQNATHFRYLPSPTDPKKKMITPCLPHESGAVAMNWVDIPDDIELLEPDITKEDFVDAIKRAKRSTNQADIDRQIKWTEEFGQGGFVGERSYVKAMPLTCSNPSRRGVDALANHSLLQARSSVSCRSLGTGFLDVFYFRRI